ncbi:hypothetical protein F5H01DRAFT_337209 [Linnemannia elongata]|nr:hypothetical protein F5H01DRAFT_337209 [Linnemannia elongata]
MLVVLLVVLLLILGKRRIRRVVAANRRSRRIEDMRHRLHNREERGHNFAPSLWTSSRFGDSITTGFGLGRVLEAV